MSNTKNTQARSEAAPINHWESVGWLINTAALKANGLMTEALTALALTQGQFAILKALAEADNITQTEIGRIVDLPGYAMTRNLDVLEQRGLLARHTDEHSRRSFRVRLSDEGRALAPRLFDITRRVNQALLEPLDADEIGQLQSLLQKLCS